MPKIRRIEYFDWADDGEKEVRIVRAPSRMHTHILTQASQKRLMRCIRELSVRGDVRVLPFPTGFTAYTKPYDWGTVFEQA